MDICDPAAGTGGFLLRAHDYIERLTPRRLAGLGGDPLLGQPRGDCGSPHTLMNAHVKDAEYGLGLLFHDLRPAIVSDAVPVGEAAHG